MVKNQKPKKIKSKPQATVPAQPTHMRAVSAPSTVSKTIWTGGNESDLIVTGRELWGVTNVAIDTVITKSFTPASSGMSRLDSYGKLFDLYRIESLDIEYVPSAGTQNNGRTVFGIDYDSLSESTSVSQVNVLNPLVSTPIWSGAALKVNPQRANKQFWLRTANQSMVETAAFVLATYVTGAGSGTIGGQLWVKYRIRFTSPRQTGSGLLVKSMSAIGNNFYGTGWTVSDDAYSASQRTVSCLSPGTFMCNLEGWKTSIDSIVAEMTTVLATANSALNVVMDQLYDVDEAGTLVNFRQYVAYFTFENLPSGNSLLGLVRRLLLFHYPTPDVLDYTIAGPLGAIPQLLAP